MPIIIHSLNLPKFLIVKKEKRKSFLFHLFVLIPRATIYLKCLPLNMKTILALITFMF